jgi:nicotinamidase-related amidase
MSSLLEPDRTALVVVDLQEKLLSAIVDRDGLLKNALLLLETARELQIPVIVTTQYAKGLGPLAPEVASALPDAPVLDKTSFDCFGSATFCRRLSELLPARMQLLVLGVESHICVMQTVLGALSRGLTVHVVSDAISSRTRENKELGLGRMEREGAVLSSTEMAVYELLSRSDTPAFKALLPRLKGSAPDPRAL